MIFARYLAAPMALAAAVSFPAGAAAPEAEREEAPARATRASQPFSVVDTRSGLSLHEDMYALPATWSNAYQGDQSEVIFQLSAKLQIFHTHLFFAYTQLAFWQLFNADESRPFRETNHNPQLFYRITPGGDRFRDWIVDVGLDHQSNGNSEPDSRSWNRAYTTLHIQKPRDLFSLRLWYRFQEDECPIGDDGLEVEQCRDHPGYDDNPDITDYMGYSEFHYRHQWTGRKRPRDIHFMARGNLATGKGGVGLDYSHAAGSKDLHWFVKVWHGYGESLLDHERSITRYGLGLLLRRTHELDGDR